jgi:RNA polymerase sigma-70 factor (ECF subfamily)
MPDDESDMELDALFRKLGPDLVRYLRGILRHGGLAEDIAQDTFLILVRKWPEIRNHPCLKAYMYTVARRLALATLRERCHEFLTREPPEHDGAGRDDPWDVYDLSAAVREAIGKLPPRQREAVWLFYFQDFAQSEIATIMQIKRGAVAALLFQARSHLAGLLSA